MPSPITTTSTAKAPNRKKFEPRPGVPDELVEKKSETRRIVPNSASDDAASTV